MAAKAIKLVALASGENLAEKDIFTVLLTCPPKLQPSRQGEMSWHSFQEKAEACPPKLQRR
jgi:hypothetical protein